MLKVLPMRLPVLILALLAAALSSFGSHHHRRTAHSGQAGVFDFYLYVLSWSPEFCHSRPSAAECSQHAGFVVHGLWPQNRDGSYPTNCATTQPGPTDSSSLAGIMPPEIIAHEWRQHGTCSGLSGDAYFGLIKRLHGSLAIPAQLKAPASSISWSPQQLKKAFESSNKALQDGELAIQLRGHYLNAVEFCLSKGADPQPIACSGVKDTTGGTFLIPPVR